MKITIEEIEPDKKFVEVKRIECDPTTLSLGHMDGLCMAANLLFDISQSEEYPDIIRDFASNLAKGIKDQLPNLSELYLSKLAGLDKPGKHSVKIFKAKP